MIYIFGANGFIGKHITDKLDELQIAYTKVSIREKKDISNYVRNDKSIIINLAHQYPKLRYSTEDTNKNIAKYIIYFAGELNIKEIIHATTSSQYNLSRSNTFDRYIYEKNIVLSLLRDSNLQITEIALASVISNIYNSNNGVDLLLKNKKKILVPNFIFNIHFANEIADEIIKYATSRLVNNEVFITTLTLKDRVINIKNLFNLLGRNKIYINEKLVEYLSKAICVTNIPVLSKTPMTIEKIEYHLNLKNKYDKEKEKKYLKEILKYIKHQ